MGNNSIKQQDLEEILQFVGEGIIYQEADGKIRLFNQVAQRIFDLSEDEAYGLTSTSHDWHLVCEDGSPCPGEEHPSMITLRTGQTLNEQIRGIAWPDRPITWLSIKTRPIFRNDQELPEAVVISFSDVTQRKQAEDGLMASKARFQAVFETNVAPKLIIDPEDGAILEANQAACRFYGYSLLELRAKTIYDLNTLTPDQVKAEMGKAKSEEKLFFSFRHRLKSGEIRDVEVYSGPIEGNERPLLYSIIFDVTDRTKAEQEQLKQRSFLERAQEIGSIGTWELDVKRDALLWTDENYRIFGLPIVTDLTYEVFLECIHHDDREYVDTEWRAAMTGKPYDIEHRLLVDGKVKWVREKAELVFDEEGNCISATGVTQDITERKQAEEALRDSEERYKLMFDNAPVGYQSLDSNGCILDVNRVWLDFLGYQHDEVIGRWFGNFLHEDQKEVFRELFPINIQSIEPIYGVEFNLKRKDGSYLPVEYTARMGRDAKGNFVRTHCVFQDITKRKQKEHELRHRFEFERLISRISSGFVGLANNETDKGINEALALIGSFVGADRAYVFIFREDGVRITNTHEWCAAEVEPQKDKLQDIKLADELPWFAQRIKAREVFHVPAVTDLPPEAALEREHFQSQGIQSLIVLPMVLGDRLIGFLGFDVVAQQRTWNEDDRNLLNFVGDAISQLLERRSTEEALRASERSYRELFNSIQDLVYTQDLQGRFLSFNPSLARIMGYEPKELVGVKPSKLMEPKFREAFDREYLGTLKRKGNYQGTSKYLTKDGGARYLEYNSSLVTTAEGEQYISGIGRDVTERIKAQKQMEALQGQLRQAQKMEAIGTLAGGIAHDFNNILAAVMGYAEISLEEIEQGKASPETVKNILVASDRAKSLVQQILTFSRRADAERVPVDLNKEILSSSNLLKQTLPKMIDIRLELSTEISPVLASPHQVEQILMNLGTNARDAMPNGGTLTIATSQRQFEGETCLICAKPFSGEYLVIAVSDTGEGIREEDLDNIFDPFFTTKEVGKGTGLGLSTVFGIVSSYGGHINCISRRGRGTTFNIYLPPSQDEIDDAGEATPTEAIEGGDETILLVDDEAHILHIGDQHLSRAGYKVLTAPNGEEALEVFNSMRDEIALVILDLSMPGMGGHKCLRELLSLAPGVKVIVSTGYSRDGDLQETMYSGAAALLPKPFSKNEMLKTVRMVLDA